ncbi:MAG: EAL domain-containing protein [Methylococcales bacterium]|nr:EAL domain-containing protein [Methylococcales bacterium]MBT7108086.1 EAL domain-containing protein [Methylococcales bacterium]
MMTEWLKSFSSSSFMPHAQCFLWQEDLIALYVISDSLIVLAYVIIPCAIVRFLRARHDIPVNKVVMLFAAFILLCGTTHFLSIITLWYPIYWLSGLVKALTGVISLMTAYITWQLVPKLIIKPNLLKNHFAIHHAYADSVKHSPNAVIYTDCNGNIIYNNPAALQQGQATMLGQEAFFFNEEKTGITLFKDIWRQLNDHKAWQGDISHSNERLKQYFHYTITPLTATTPEGLEEIQYSSVAIDITRRVEAEDLNQLLVRTDSLTQLPNRVTFREQINCAIKVAKEKNTQFAILYIDIDRFKAINDNFGHHIGDLLLKMVSKRIQSSIRTSDIFARLSGDEFCVLLTPWLTQNNIEDVIDKIKFQLKNPILLPEEKLSIQVSISIGIAFYPEHGETYDALVQHSDTAMYHVKNTGRNSYAFCSPELVEKNRRKQEISIALQEAIKHDQLTLVFQPKANISTQEISGFEALLRWKHPGLGAIAPAEFIPVAEHSGFIQDLGVWTLRKACEQLNIWQNQTDHPYTLAINISAHQLHQESFVQSTSDIIEAAGVNPALLEFEITESIFIDQPLLIREKIIALKKKGIKFSLDDYGTGYASLSLLTQLPINILKIDMSFIHSMINNQTHRIIIENTITMAQALKIKVIAEGVETVQQLELLKTYHCNELQGNLLSPPLSSQEIANNYYTTSS